MKFKTLLLLLLPSFLFSLDIYQTRILTLQKSEKWLSNRSVLISDNKGKPQPAILTKQNGNLYLTTLKKHFGPFEAPVSLSISSDSWAFSFTRKGKTILVSSTFGQTVPFPRGKVKWSQDHSTWLLLFQTNKQKFLKTANQTLGPFEHISEWKFLPHSSHWIIKATVKKKNLTYYDGTPISLESNFPILQEGEKIIAIHSPMWKQQAFILDKGKEQFFIYNDLREGPYKKIPYVFLSDVGHFAYFYKNSISINLRTDRKTYGPYFHLNPNRIYFNPHTQTFAWLFKNGKKHSSYTLFINGKKTKSYKNFKDFDWHSSGHWKASILYKKRPAFLIDGKVSEAFFHTKWYGFSPDGSIFTYLGERKNGFYIIGTKHPDFGPFKKVSFFTYTSPEGNWSAAIQHFNTLWYLHNNKGDVVGPFDDIKNLKGRQNTCWVQLSKDHKNKIRIDDIEIDKQGYHPVSVKKEWFWLEENNGTIYLDGTVKPR